MITKGRIYGVKAFFICFILQCFISKSAAEGEFPLFVPSPPGTQEKERDSKKEGKTTGRVTRKNKRG